MPRKSVATEYANTDFDLKSCAPFSTLHEELSKACCELHYTQGDDGCWYACYEAEWSESGSAATDIRAILDAIGSLSSVARTELEACSTREFNIGFHCWDTWAYTHSLAPEIVADIAQAACSIAVTLYPMRNVDGSPR